MPIIRIGENLRVAKLARQPRYKTDTYLVLSNTDGEPELGRIRWYSPWRCYAFHPATSTVFEKDCLRDLARFLEQIEKDRKAEREAGR